MIPSLMSVKYILSSTYSGGHVNCSLFANIVEWNISEFESVKGTGPNLGIGNVCDDGNVIYSYVERNV